jgi:murein DD-endopeptidase MepM/ murein hydrolase activator NlpD
MIYTQKERLGKPFGSPDIKVAMIETGKKKEFIYADERGLPYMGSCKTVTYDAKGNPVTAEEIRRLKRKQRFGMPLRHVRITSRFTYKRWHPILHRYRPHLGVDFGARRGTPLLAVNAGKVIFSGRKGGYGNVVKIKHRGGYVSLYAHQSRIRVKKGQQVKKGQVIGYVGSTGRSTGPHLHFGLYKNGRAVDPLKVLKKKSGGRLQRFITKKIEIKGAKQNKARVIKMLENPPENYKWNTIKANFVLVNDRAVYEQQKEGS